MIICYQCVWLVVWGFSSGAAANTGVFKKPSVNSDERIGLLQNDLLKVQSEIKALNSSLSSAGSYEDIKTRFSLIENDFQKLKEQLGDLSREGAVVEEKNRATLAAVNSFYNTLDTQLKNVQGSVQKMEEEEASRRLPADVVEEIRSQRFKRAEELLISVVNRFGVERVHSIVHVLYANSDGNANMILDFAKALMRVDLSARVLIALQYEMKSNGHHDPYKLIALVQAIQTQVSPYVDSAFKTKVDGVVGQTLADIVRAASRILETAVYSGTYGKNVEVETLSNALFYFNKTVSAAVFERVVNETYRNVPAVTLADLMSKGKKISQSATGLVTLFRQLEKNNSLNDKAVLNIAKYLKHIKGSKNYPNTLQTVREAVDNVIEKMPTCAKNLHFASSVCIWNKHRSEYLYAASSPFNYDRYSRSIFTWTTGEMVLQGTWVVERYEEHYYFKNTVHQNEYIFASLVEPYEKEKRYVFTWIDGGGGIIKDKSGWEIQLNGDFCYLKNKNYNEYLFASDAMHSEKRRYVFTWIPKTSDRHDAFQWQIRNCD